MNLAQSKKNIVYKVEDIKSDSELIKSRLFQLGFTLGNTLILKRKAPIFGDPLLFEIGVSQIALTKEEASLIQVSEIK